MKDYFQACIKASLFFENISSRIRIFELTTVSIKLPIMIVRNSSVAVSSSLTLKGKLNFQNECHQYPQDLSFVSIT